MKKDKKLLELQTNLYNFLCKYQILIDGIGNEDHIIKKNVNEMKNNIEELKEKIEDFLK